jgi:hypothetical protein
MKKNKEENNMQKIESSRKYQNGVQVFWTEEGKEFTDFFPYEELIDMKINALDLLNNPAIYRIDAQKHTIESSV